MKNAKTILLWAYLAVANHVVSKVPLNSVRTALYRGLFGIAIGRGSVIHMGAFVLGPRKIAIGDHTLVNPRCVLDGRMGITIGDNVDVAMDVQILTLGHDVNTPDYQPNGGPVTIGDRASIFTRAMVLPGVRIGEGSVVGAGSVVTHDVEPYTIVAGAPAKKIGERTRDLDYTLRISRYFC